MLSQARSGLAPEREKMMLCKTVRWKNKALDMSEIFSEFQNFL